MTILDDILEGSTDPAVSAADLLRKVQIAASRLGATEIVAWARGELSGYGPDDALPNYREIDTGVMGLFTGPLQSQIRQPLTVIPPGMETMWEVELRQPLVELQALSQNENDSQIQWPATVVSKYAATGAFAISLHNLFSAWNVLSRQKLLGVIDIVRSRAMEFALELQANYPNAGEVGGPTVAETPGLASTVYNITNNITGHGTNIAAGPDARQRSTVHVGDTASFLARLDELGLVESDRDEFVAAVTEDESVDGQQTSGFLARVRSGAVRLAEGMATDVAADLLIAAGRAYLGINGF